MQKCIELMRDALVSLARGQVLLPLRPVLRIPETRNVYALMPAYSKALNAIGTKLITVFPDNHGTEFDSHQGAVILIDGERGNLKALMDAASITAIRTAAVSGVATELLARRDATTLAVLGSGVQARTHIDAMLAVRPFTNVLVWSRNADHARALVAGVGQGRDVTLEVVRDAESAVRRADVICTVTASPKPVLHGEWLRPGSHVNAVGASLPTTRELDSDAVRRAEVWVDRRESALNEAGDLMVPVQEGAISADHIRGEIGTLLSGDGRGRNNDTEITIFKSLGLAIEDLACAHYLHQRATEERTGAWVDL
jgi:ornithine cyclodeaminase/alanine dehydrogenase-like protein (mu-crystallin family)